MIECAPCGRSFKNAAGFSSHAKTQDHKMRTGQFDLKEFLRANKIKSRADLKRVMSTPFRGKIRTLR